MACRLIRIVTQHHAQDGNILLTHTQTMNWVKLINSRETRFRCILFHFDDALYYLDTWPWADHCVYFHFKSILFHNFSHRLNKDHFTLFTFPSILNAISNKSNRWCHINKRISQSSKISAIFCPQWWIIGAQ